MSEAPYLRLDGYEGPLDLLLELARAQKVDLAALDIVALADQFLRALDAARGLRPELAADWLVTAAWLAWLKSRLLLPEPEPDPDAEAATETLADRLRGLEALRAGAAWLGARPALGRDVFARGMPERLEERRDGAFEADLPGLLHARTMALRRLAARRPYAPVPRRLWTVGEAMARLLGAGPDWAGPDWVELARFLPAEAIADPLERRAAIAATLIAGLELARSGGAVLRQESAFGPILLLAVASSASAEGATAGAMAAGAAGIAASMPDGAAVAVGMAMSDAA